MKESVQWFLIDAEIIARAEALFLKVYLTQIIPHNPNSIHPRRHPPAIQPMLLSMDLDVCLQKKYATLLDIQLGVCKFTGSNAKMSSISSKLAHTEQYIQ